MKICFQHKRFMGHAVQITFFLSLMLGLPHLAKGTSSGEKSAISVPPIAEQGEEEINLSPASGTRHEAPQAPGASSSGKGVTPPPGTGTQPSPPPSTPSHTTESKPKGSDAHGSTQGNTPTKETQTKPETLTPEENHEETQELPQPEKKGSGFLWFLGVFVALSVLIFLFT